MKTRKVGMNKGRPRIWLEGAELTDNDIKHGMRFNVETFDGIIRIIIDDDGKRKIAGTPARPVIDMTGRIIECANLIAGDHFTITKRKDGIELRYKS